MFSGTSHGLLPEYVPCFRGPSERATAHPDFQCYQSFSPNVIHIAHISDPDLMMTMRYNRGKTGVSLKLSLHE